jgi:hypothetical protein
VRDLGVELSDDSDECVMVGPRGDVPWNDDECTVVAGAEAETVVLNAAGIRQLMARHLAEHGSGLTR